MLILKREVQAALKFTRQEYHYTDARGKERTIRYQVVGPAEDGSWMIKQMYSDGTWTYVDTAGVCANYYLQGHSRKVQAVELLMLRQHVEKLGQLCMCK